MQLAAMLGTGQPHTALLPSVGLQLFRPSQVPAQMPPMPRCLSCTQPATAPAQVGFKATGRKCSVQGCAGRLRDWVLDWESPLPEDLLQETERQASAADLALVLGSSLQIQPANQLPLRTQARGASAGAVEAHAPSGVASLQAGSCTWTCWGAEVLSRAVWRVCSLATLAGPPVHLHLCQSVATCDLAATCFGEAKQLLVAGGKLVICNLQETDVDLAADLVIHERVDTVMGDLASRLQLVRGLCSASPHHPTLTIQK